MLPKWSALLIGSAAATYVLGQFSVPAGTIVGPLIVAIIFQAAGFTVILPSYLVLLTRCGVGVLIGSAIPITSIIDHIMDGAVYMIGVLSVIAGATLIGIWFAKSPLLPGATAIWALTPGAATAMSLEAPCNACDIRIVAFMQYFRVLVIGVLGAILSSAYSAERATDPGGSATAFPSIAADLLQDPAPFLSFGIICITFLLVSALPMRSFALIMGIFLTLAVSILRPFRLSLSPFVVASLHYLVAWELGGRFQKHDVLVVFQTLPLSILATGSLVAWTAGVAYPFSIALDIDYLVAILALMPGGFTLAALSTGISGTGAEVVVITQALRLLIVMLFVPTINRAISKRLQMN